MKRTEIESIVSQMTLEEKAGLCSGRDGWTTKPLERLNIPSIRTSDGPHGLRLEEKDEDGFATAKMATCFPAACATAASFNPALLRELGSALGTQCQANHVHVLLGPGVNIKRSPLCGRNFEYFSEDPLLAGRLGSAFVQGLQEQGVGASLKHFFANNQEYRRMNSTSEMDERTMREVYLSAFERVVKEAQPWTIMASYNKIDGTFSTENKRYLTDVLRREWGFEGSVVSDWGATRDRAAAVAAGTDLTMPSATKTDAEIVQAVREGRLQEAELDAVCVRLLELVFRGVEAQKDNVTVDYEAAHELAKRIEADSIVLLKNESSLLPLKKNAKIAFIGTFAKAPRYQGGGSSHVNSYRVPGALEYAEQYANIAFAEGYAENQLEPDMQRIAEAVETAKNASAAVIFAGLPEKMESEGYDRAHMKMPESHNALIRAVCEAQPNTVVVLHNGAPVETPWADGAAAILETYLGGEAVGEAVADVLFGETEPGGRLPESFPLRLEDNPSYLSYGGEDGTVYYAERMFVGYRYYESKGVPVRWPFGYGLSYADFSITDLRLDKEEITDDNELAVQCRVENTGSRRGKAVVQLYVAPPQREGLRPVRELRGFEKVELAPGESRDVTFTLTQRDFAYWRISEHKWAVQDGAYEIQIGTSCHDIVLRRTLSMRPSQNPPLTMESLIKEFLQYPTGLQCWKKHSDAVVETLAKMGLVPRPMLEEVKKLIADPAAIPEGMGMILKQPVKLLCTFIGDLSQTQLQAMLDTINQNERN